ncbi:aldo/keto reductase [Chitinophaga rhizophila]|uniref:Aldo/keto reductase n=1 Tax=Chitinophaga rhizophila TaxID=2866212 RepID=A0ABS7GL97_9BACT|nr:aldo/keto reductase [Chitinophaga rhizophila]MBW8687990.1 aldo/keto reductase [Chitinophaga rhizophila]
MIQLHELSKIGFGMYRTSVSQDAHLQALLHAVNNGCNLLDTASNYENGASELLVGKLLESVPRTQLFIVTKAGYISGDNLNAFRKLQESGKALQEVVTISDTFLHSMHPEYLRLQIDTSLLRMGTSYLDGFLLHSPEYFFEQPASIATKQEYYRRFEQAFAFLETEVAAGRIRYYGVSSNTLGITEGPKATNLAELIAVANRVSADNHFKLIQFPYNIIEHQADIYVPAYNTNLLEMATRHGIRTFGNRPLNANSAKGMLRMVIYPSHHPDSAADQAIHDECFTILEQQLLQKKPGSSLNDFALLSFLKDNWKAIPHEEAFNKLFYGTLYPIAHLLYDNNIPPAVMELLQSFQRVCWQYCLHTTTERAITWLKDNNYERLLPTSTEDTLPASLCREYLSRGLDHVLVGMRRIAYVEELQSVFAPAARVDAS